jgi:uncharacterized protein YdeI (YjbR/CyaY-like superfamily)
MKPRFFRTSSDFRAWLEKHHEVEKELWVGFHKRSSGRPSITWPEAVDVALCFGWIDGVRKSIDDASYVNRFTPRRNRSHWSLVNVKRVEELTRRGQMTPAGIKAFEERSKERTGLASYEQGVEPRLEADHERQLRANDKAWRWFQSQAPWYRRAAVHWVVSAKKEETRLKRLARLIDDSEHGRAISPLARNS